MQLEDNRGGKELLVEDSRGENDQLEVEPVVCLLSNISGLLLGKV